MDDLHLLHDLAVVMLTAGVTTLLCHRFKQPVVLGYILAGFIVGPYTPPFSLVEDKDTVHTLGEMGVVLLMFSLGLEFNLRKLTKVGMAALIAAVLEIVLMIWIGYEIGVHAFGWNVMDSVFVGAMLSISSTTIIIKALAETGKTRAPFAEVIFGILIIEDILAIVLLVLLSSFAQTGKLQPTEVVFEFIKLAVFLAVVLVCGFLTIPRLLNYTARFRSNEVQLITALGLCFAGAVAALFMHYSVALGAFIMGAIIAESREIHRIEHLTAPVRDMFSAIFFVAIGMLIEPRVLVQFAVPILLLSLLVVVGKVVTCSFGVFVGGRDVRTSLSVGLGLAQIGEFSFIIATLGSSLKVTGDFLYPVAVAVSVITTLITPYLIRHTDDVAVWIDRCTPKPLIQALSVYTTWVGTMGGNSPNPLVLLVRRMGWNLFVNLLLTIGVFAIGAWVEQLSENHWPHGMESPGLHQALVWIGVIVCTAPIYLASARTIQAMSVLIAEICVPVASSGTSGNAARHVISQVFILISFVLMTFITILLCASIAVDVFSIIPMLLVVTVAALIFRPILVRIYSRAEIALHETLIELPGLRSPAPKMMPELLEAAELETLELPASSPMLGRKLRDVPLRTQTGASIVAIERTGLRLINPGPDETLIAGDRVLLLGEADQLPNARDLLLSNPLTQP